MEGLIIEQFEANSVILKTYESKESILGNSLFSEYLLKNGLKITGSNRTRDIINVAFTYSIRSYKDEIKFWTEKIASLNHDSKLKDDEKLSCKKYYEERLVLAEKNSKIHGERSTSPDDLRKILYRDGALIEYKEKSKDGKIRKTEVIKYRMLYRSAGQAKNGTCMFIRENLYDKALDFLRMGISLPDKNVPVVEIGAYASLIASNIDSKIGNEGKVRINPRNILIIKDIDSYFETKVINVEKRPGTENQCTAETVENYKVKNTLFDGQALIDKSLFPKEGEGFILLRQHFCKMAAFCADLKLFFRDYCLDHNLDYETYKVQDIFGNEHLLKDIELITTDNAMKWLKFQDYDNRICYDFWCRKVEEMGNDFGIVKTAHRSKHGDVQQMSYQMVNALEMNEEFIRNITESSNDYIMKLKNDQNEFFEYIKNFKTSFNDFEVLKTLCDYNPEFYRSDYYRDRKSRIITVCSGKIREGKLLQPGDNLVIVGSPYAMLLASVTKDFREKLYLDETLSAEVPGGVKAIQCYSERFDFNEFLAEFRSPFNGRNNIGCLYNVNHPFMKKYFKLGKQVIAINMIGTDAQDRNNGSDQDSDFLFVTNQKDIVECAKKYYVEYPTIVNNIPKDKNHYNNTPEDFARVDNELAAAQTVTGEASNLAQLCLVYANKKLSEDEIREFEKNLCILSVAAQIAIDNAKRKYDIDLPGLVKNIKKEINPKKNGYPVFWEKIVKKQSEKTEDSSKNEESSKDGHGERHNKENKVPCCPMDLITEHKFAYAQKTEGKSMDYFFKKFELNMDKRTAIKAEEIIDEFSVRLLRSNEEDDDDSRNEYRKLESIYREMISKIKKICKDKDYRGFMSLLLDRAFYITPAMKANLPKSNDAKNRKKHNTEKRRPLLLKVLYDLDPEALKACFSKNLETS